MGPTRNNVIGALVCATAALGACGAAPVGDAPTTAPPTPCIDASPTFYVTLASDATGQVTPERAARDFAAHDESLVGTPADDWSEIPDPMGQTVEAPHEVVLRSGTVYVRVITLPNGAWAVISGGHCALRGE